MSVSVFPNSEFPTIYCTKLVIDPDTTTLKWDNSRRDPEIEIIGPSDVAKSLVTGTTKGVISSTGYTVGTSDISWYLIMHETTSAYFGIALYSQNLQSIDDVVVKQLINTVKKNRVYFFLTIKKTLIIRHENHNGTAIKTYVFDITKYDTLKVYPWISSNIQNTISVKIMLNVRFVMDVNSDGLVRMTGSKNDIVDFNIGEIFNNGGVTITPSADNIVNVISGSHVQATDDGSIDIKGGITYKCDNIISAIQPYIIDKDQYAIMLTNPVTITVLLPEASSKCRKHIIFRNYPLQIGETWQNPYLKIQPVGSNTIENELFVGLPPDSSIEVLSDGINTWHIV